jgi:2-dehydro-3-deoxy-D-arabinonate dehydratase
MRLGQIRLNNEVIAAIFEPGDVRPIADHTLLALIARAEAEKTSLEELAREQAAAYHEHADPIIPIHPREVWAAGCTYQQSAEFRDAEHGTREGFYSAVYAGDRPEIFFKGSARHCVGTGKNIGIRSDSKFTAPEPELAVLLGKNGTVLGYSLANDVSAWDIERENPLYLPQSKIFTASCALGPVWVTPSELHDPYSVEIRCAVRRDGAIIFEGASRTSNMCRKIEELIAYLLRANPVPSGSVLLTGTGIIVPQSAALVPGDVVEISAEGIGTLSNTAAVV